MSEQNECGWCGMDTFDDEFCSMTCEQESENWLAKK